MDSYGDKFLSAPDDSRRDRDRDRNRGERDGFGAGNIPGDPQSSNYNSMGSYDPYSSNKPLSEKIGVILGDVDKIKEGDNSEQIKQKIAQNHSKKWAKQAEDHRGRLPGLRQREGAAARPAAVAEHGRRGAPRRELPRLI